MSIINDVIIDRFIADAFSRLGRIDRLLDLGCGRQPYAPHYRPAAAEVVTADFEARSPISVRLSAMALPFRAQSFDAVLFSEVLEHLDDPEEALREIARVLRPGGHLLLTMPFNYMQHEIPHDHVRYTQFGLAAALARNGLRIRRLYQRGSLLTLMVAQVEFLVRLVGARLARVPLLGRFLRPINHVSLRLWISVVAAMWGQLVSRNLIDADSSDLSILSGSTLHGGRGHMRLWTLGYCLVAQRQNDR